MDAASVYQTRKWLQRLSAACSTCNPAEELLSPFREPALTVRNRLEALRSSRGLQQAQSLMLWLQVMIVNQARTLAAQARRLAPQHPIRTCRQHRDKKVVCRLSRLMATSAQQQVWTAPAAACICTTGQARQACTSSWFSMEGTCVSMLLSTLQRAQASGGRNHGSRHSRQFQAARYLPAVHG